MNYGAGEATDRLTVLALKILHGSLAGKDVSHFETERSSLLAQIRTRTLNGSWFEQVLQVGAVNAALWYAEDQLRELRRHQRDVVDSLSIESAGAVAFRIQDLNDQRSALIEAINKLTGEHLGSEKIV